MTIPTYTGQHMQVVHAPNSAVLVHADLPNSACAPADVCFCLSSRLPLAVILTCVCASAPCSRRLVSSTLNPKPHTLNPNPFLAPAGFFASACSLPFDFVKTRLQKMTPNADGSMPYKGPVDCAMQTLKQEGPLKFYTGFPTYLVR